MSEDSLEPLVTQCPNCDTRFRVTESQLQVASGRVRCGACLVVFEGTDYLTLDGDQVNVEDDTDVDALLEELDEISRTEPTQPPALPVIDDDDLAPITQAELAQSGSEEEALPEELLALERALLDEMRVPEPEPDAPEEPPELEPEEPEAEQSEPAEPESTDQSDQLDDALEVIELKTPTPAPPKAIAKLPYYEEEEEPKRRSLVTPMLIMLALIGLPAQVLWFQYNAWVTDVNYRPIYQFICDVADCELPPMRDVSKIVAKKTYIRTHPDRSDARIVDVLMVNNADFPQPYPLIELIATNLQGQLVAGRRFKPSEYLQGDARGAQLMPRRTPVHVSLEIQDPAEEALNFEVWFRSR